MAAQSTAGQSGAGGVFLSHAGLDKQAARTFAEILQRNGIAVWFDTDALKPGEPWMTTLERAIRQSSAMIVYVGRLGVQAWVDREVRFGLILNTNNPDTFRLIPVLGEGADPAALPPFLSQQQFVDLRDKQSAPEQIRRLVETLRAPAGILGVPSTGPFPPGYWETHSPFRSLTVFEPEDSWLFFGRDAETERLLELLGRAPVLAVLGNSGSGKSSLIRAGLVPALQRGRFPERGSAPDSWRVAVFRPSNDPFQELAETLPGQLAPELSPSDRMALIEQCKKNFPSGGEALRNAIAAVAKDSRTLLVADQFEEIFTLTTDAEIRSRYIESLLAAARIEGAFPVYLVVSIRADFYANCLDHPKLSELLEANLFNVPRMEGPQLREAIEQRLALAAARAEPGLIDSLLADVGTEPGNLALLEHTLGQLWKKRGPDRTLTSQSYTDIGRLQGALGRHADDVVRDIRVEALQRLVPKIFLDLVQLGEGAQDTRRRVPKQRLLRLGNPDQVERLLDQLAAGRLILVGKDFVEVSHEALIRAWPKLRGWLDENREDLRLERSLVDAADEWERKNKDPGYLLQGARLAQAEDWLAKHSEYSAATGQFVAASRKARKEREWLIRKLAYVLAAVSVAALAAAGVASYKTVVARRDQAISYSSSLVNVSENVKDRDLRVLVALNAAASWDTAEAERALHTAMQAFRGPRFYAPGQNYAVKGMAFSGDSKLLATANSDSSVTFWNAQNGTPLGTPVKFDAGVENLAWRANGTLAVATSRGTVQMIDSSGKVLQPEIALSNSEVKSVVFSSDGDTMAAGAQDGNAFLYTGQTRRLTGHTGPVRAVVFNPQGGYVVTASVDGTALGWDVRTGQKMFKLGADGDAPLLSLAISSGGTFAATGDAAGSIHIWEIPAGRALGEWQHSQRKKVEGLAFSADGRTLASASQDGTIKLWDVAASGSMRERLAIPCSEGDRVAECTALAFMKDGHTLGVAGYNGEIRLYETDFDKLFEQARSNLDTRQMNIDECKKYLHQSECVVPGGFTRRAR
jgi:hypothetical protein